jgi:hypothetical protein
MKEPGFLWWPGKGTGTPDHQWERHLRHQATPPKDLGARFGLSGESVRQMEMKALKAMRGMAAA